MQLTILYTANLRGNLDLLPRLYTFLRRLRQPMTGRVLLLDAGNACNDSAWHCAATGGRSALLVLDAMGYAAANARGFLSAEGRARLDDNHLGMAALGEHDVWESDGVFITAADPPAVLPHDLHVVLACAEATTLEAHTLRLAEIDAPQVGVIQIASAGENGRLTIRQQEILPMPAATLPDPTIVATVDFVVGEARYYQRRRGDKDGA